MATIRLSRIRAEQRPTVGISLAGPPSLAVGMRAVYTITDFDAFSVYTVKSTVGTVAVDRDKITLTIPGTTIASQLTLEISVSDIKRNFVISLRPGNIISAPTITSPATETSGLSPNLTLQGSSFSSLPIGTLTHTATEWMIALDQNFTLIAVNQTVSSGSLSSFTANLAQSTTYYARMRYISDSIVSEWTPVISFTTTSVAIQKPIVVTQNGQTTNIGMDFVVTGSAFTSIPANVETHVSSSWIVRTKADDSIAYQVTNSSTDKLALTVPVANLKTSTEYSIEARYNGQLTQSPFSDKLMITTASVFIPSTPGTAFQGGYYIGRINIGGVIYALILSPKSSGENLLPMCYENIAGPSNLVDGLSNTNEMSRGGSSLFPAVEWVKSLSIGGYRDWYIPSVDELELCYRYAKPSNANNLAQSSGGPRGAMGYNPSSIPSGSAYTATNPRASTAAIFRTTGAQEMKADIPYWTSSYAGSSTWGRFYTQDFAYGGQSAEMEITYQNVRAVRRVRIS